MTASISIDKTNECVTTSTMLRLESTINKLVKTIDIEDIEHMAGTVAVCAMLVDLQTKIINMHIKVLDTNINLN